MNVQIWGRSKCFDTKKAERYFKERGVKFQYIEIDQKGMSLRELESVISGVGGVDKLFDSASKAYEQLNIAYITRTAEDKKELLMNNFKLYKTPVVRDGRQATTGYVPEVWKDWK